MRLFRSPDFRLLALSNGLSSLGDELALVALTIKVFELSDGSGIAVAAVLLAGILPLVLFAPFAGLIVDRTETTGTLALASAAQAFIAVGLAFAEPVWLVVALSFLLGSAASIASPAVFAIVPTAVDEEDLTEANANMETVRYIGMVAGPLIAGGLAGALGADRGTRAALLLDAITFLVITSAAASLKVRRQPESAPEEGRTKGEARQGFAFIRRDRVLLIGVAAVATTVLFATMDNVAEVFFANDPELLNAGNWGYGALAAVWLLGMVVGAGLIARRLPQERLAPAVLLSSITGGAAVAIAALFPNIVLALAMFTLGGVANGVASVSMRSLIHHRVPDQLRGRVFAAYFGVAFAGQLAATALGGVLIAVLPSSRDVLLVGGLGGTLVGLIGLAWFAALPLETRAPHVVHLPDTEPVRPGMVVVRDITPPDDTVVEPEEVVPSANPSA
ncbi:MAG: MFS transporter [Actinomycetota bacterium]